MTSDIVERLVDEWRQKRLATGISLRELARRTDINPGRLSIIERGVPPTIAEAEAIEAALAVIEPLDAA